MLDAADGLVENLTRLCAMTDGPIRWVGMGPMTNLYAVLCLVPDLAERITLTQMGGWLDRYRDKTRASRNFRTDPVAAGIALRLVRTPQLVLSDFTNSSAIDITADSELLRRLRSATAPKWAQLLAANFEAWFDRQSARQQRRGSWMRDPLTFSAALGLPFVTFTPERIRIERDARIYRDPDGRAMEVACEVDYEAFVEWMHEGYVRELATLDPTTSTTDAHNLGLHNLPPAPPPACAQVQRIGRGACSAVCRLRTRAIRRREHLISVACPAVLCGSVSVSDNRIGAHHTWNAQPCEWAGARIIDDTAQPVQAMS